MISHSSKNGNVKDEEMSVDEARENALKYLKKRTRFLGPIADRSIETGFPITPWTFGLLVQHQTCFYSINECIIRTWRMSIMNVLCH